MRRPRELVPKPPLLLRAAFTAALLALLAAGCAPPATRAPEAPAAPSAAPTAPEDFPEAYYRQLAARGRPVFRVDGGRSLLVIEVHRGGSLARVGHDHVIASHALRGYLATEDSRADLYFRLDELVVDEPELRAEAKLETHPSPEDIAGTRRNMLVAFDAERYPFAVARIAGTGASPGDAPPSVTFSLHGATRTMDVPVEIRTVGDELTVTGRTVVKQTDFDIKPLSVLGGALQVQDEVQLSFSVRARRVR